jgi:type II secretory pathway pseudopilin PulG
VEIMVVIVIIGLLAALAMPGYRMLTLRAKATAFQNDIRAITGVFQSYNLERGRWPAEVSEGVVPPEVANGLPAGFSRPTVIGGLYDWDQNVAPNGFNTRAAISIVSTGATAMTNDLELLERIDLVLDDGNLATGNVRLGSTNALVIIIEL